MLALDHPTIVIDNMFVMAVAVVFPNFHVDISDNNSVSIEC